MFRKWAKVQQVPEERGAEDGSGADVPTAHNDNELTPAEEEFLFNNTGSPYDGLVLQIRVFR
jgi:hypothetical protein